MRDITLGDTFYLRFTTRAFATGIPTTLAGTPVLSVYEENNLTQITAGVSITVDSDSVTGLNQATIVGTSGNGYEENKSYDLVVTTGTVDGVSVVGEVVGSFTVGVNANQVWDEVLTGATHNVPTSAGRRLRGIQDFQGYENGAIWVDTVNGAAGTTDYENGTVENAVDSWADALTLNASLGFDKFILKNASTITLSANSDGYHIIGSGASTLAFNGQSVIGITVENCVISGVMAGTGTTQRLVDCGLGAITLIKGTHTHGCSVTATQTVGEAGDLFYDNCHSGIAGTDTWDLDFGAAIGNTNFNLRHYSGGIRLENMGDTGTDTMSIEGNGQVIEGTCTGGAVAIRGNFTTSGITNLTLTNGARFDSEDLVDDIWDEPIVGHISAGTTGLSEALGGAAIVDTTITGTPTTTVFAMTAGSATDDFYNDQMAYILSGTGIGQARVVLDYDGATKTVTIDEPFIAAPAATDRVVILIDHVHPITQIAHSVWDDDISAHTTANSAGKALQDIEDDTNELQTDDVPGLIAALNDISVADVLTTQMTEAYAADGTAPTLAQAIFLIQQSIGDFSISGTTLTAKKLDGSTTAATYTLDDATAPTSRTRAT